MIYRAVVTDFDGTLLRSDHTISDFTKRTIRDYKDEGGLFFIATGRMNAGILSQLEKVGLDRDNFPLISYQGALVKNSLTGEVLFSKPMSFSLALDTVRFLEKRGVYCQTYLDDRLIVPYETDNNRIYASVNGVKLNIVGVLSKYLSGISGACPTKILAMAENDAENDALARDLIKEFGDRASVHIPGSFMVDIYSPEAGKDKAIEDTLKPFALTLNDCMIFGDNYNDCEMIKRAGLGVAVANAVPAAKKAARIVGYSNDEDCVAKFMIKNMQNDIALR